MEGYETQLEAQSGKEEHHRHYLERGSGQGCGDAGKVGGTGCTVYHGDTIKHQGRREHGVQDEFGSCFRAVMAVFVESHQTGHRDTGQFQAHVEQNEAACADHEIHTQQRAEREHIEFSGFVTGIFS